MRKFDNVDQAVEVHQGFAHRVAETVTQEGS